MFFMGVVLKAGKEKNEDGIPEQGVHLGKCHRQCSQKFTFSPPANTASAKMGMFISWQAQMVICASCGHDKNRHLLLLKQNKKVSRESQLTQHPQYNKA